MGLLGDVFSGIDTQKRRLRGLLDDPLETLAQGVRNFGEDQSGLLNLQANAYPMPGNRTVLNSPQQIAQFRRQLADAGANMAMAAATNVSAPVNRLAAQLQASEAMTDAARAEAMRAVKYDRGWYRGGPAITDGKKSGDWYTRLKDEASDYAARTPGAEVREYAAPINTIKSDSTYSPRLAQDIASKVESMGLAGETLARQLREYYTSDKISGLEVWSGLSKHLGDDTAARVLKELGFKGVEGVKKPQYLQIFPSTMVRDANRAAFHPEKLNQNDIYGKATPGLLALTAGGAAGLAALRNSRANE